MLLSTDITSAAPLDANSNEIFPVPLNRSSTLISSNSIWFKRILNSASFARSVVGRTGRFLGGLSLSPLKVPPMIRIMIGQQVIVFYTPQFQAGFAEFLYYSPQLCQKNRPNG